MRWFKKKFVMLSQPQKQQQQQQPLDNDDATRMEECRQQLQSWIHRDELLDIDHPPYQMLPRVRDLEYPLSVPAMIGSQMQQTFEQEQSHFVQLPTELRLQIYNSLFKDRTIHLHCGFWPGDWRGGRQWRKPWGVYMEGYEEYQVSMEEQKLPNQWHFFHSVCSNNYRFAPKAKHGHCNIDWELRPEFHNKCIYKVESHKGFLSWEPYDTETVGVMPLLLGCRKMYVGLGLNVDSIDADMFGIRYTEVVYFIYSMNTFTITYSSAERLRHRDRDHPQPYFDFSKLPALLQPRNFANITSLDLEMMTLELYPKEDSTSDGSSCIRYFNSELYLSWWNVLASMPKLQRLYVSLELYLSPPLTDPMCNAILTPIDAMHGKRLKEFHLATTKPAFRVFRRHKNPPYTSISFWAMTSNVSDGSSTWDHGWDDGAWAPQDHDYFPPPDWDTPRAK